MCIPCRTDLIMISFAKRSAWEFMGLTLWLIWQKSTQKAPPRTGSRQKLLQTDLRGNSGWWIRVPPRSEPCRAPRGAPSGTVIDVLPGVSQVMLMSLTFSDPSQAPSDPGQLHEGGRLV